MSPMGKCPLINSNCTQCLSLSPFHQPLPPGPDPIGEKTFTYRQHLPIASIRCDTWSIRYLIVVAYGYLSSENWDLIAAMGKCRLWVNVAWVNVTMGICRMGICRLAGISFKAELLRRRGKAISYLETTLPLSCDSLLFPSYPFPLFVLNT